MEKEEIKIEYKEAGVEEESQTDFRDIVGVIPTVTDFPTWTPRKYSECMALYNATTVYKFCVYVNNSWKSVNIT